MASFSAVNATFGPPPSGAASGGVPPVTAIPSSVPPVSAMSGGSASIGATLSPAHPFFVANDDLSAQQFVIVLLSGSNYHSWGRSMRMGLHARNKLPLIDSPSSVPSPDVPLWSAWDQANVLVLGWIQRSVAPEIAQSILWFNTAVEAWEDLRERFSEGNEIRISDLYDEIAALKQGSLSISSYFTKFRVLWEEFLILRPLPVCSCNPKCMCDASSIPRGYMRRDQVIRFLKGLNESFGHIKSQLLMMDPLPSINKVFSNLAQHERQSVNPSLLPTALAAHTHGALKGQHSSQGGSSKGQTSNASGQGGGKKRPYCTHCEGYGHTVDRCYKLHGYPPGYKHRRVNAAVTEVDQLHSTEGVVGNESVVLTRAQHQSLLHQMQSPQVQHLPATPAVNLVTSTRQMTPTPAAPASIPSAAAPVTLPSTDDSSYIPQPLGDNDITTEDTCTILSSSNLALNSMDWIVDSGATDHVVSVLHLF
ncbi:unnamed protein product [Linum trigynum]|uniref:Retrotransposon Copia-like N-terminal domain-containing protein n=1 Tax=Linum trigynum TaxID=586398 RepID=A0AAV2F843_9ROSI